MKSKIIEMCKKSNIAISIYDFNRYILNKYIINDELYTKRRYKRILKYKLNLDNPKSFNEKLQWLKLNIRESKHTQLVDKYAVREYISNEIGEKYLIPIIGIYDSFDEMNFDDLPNNFILKCTHNSGGNVICRDKQNFDKEKARKKINRCLKNNYYYLSREWPYKNVKPRIICEKLLFDENGELPKDYKFFCFNGQPKLIQVDIDRFNKHKQNFYDVNWNFRDVKIFCENDKNMIIPKPANYEEMLTICKKLSANMPHVRVDLYNINGQIYFGELTFFHMGGFAKFKDEDLNIEMGEWIDLSTNIKYR